MRGLAKITGIFFVLLTFLTMALADRKTAAEAQSLIRRATEASDVWSAGAVQLGIRVKFFAVKAGAIDATFKKVSESRKRWRATFSSPEYNAIAIGGDGQVWAWSDAQEKPIRVHQFERALAALSQSVVSDSLEYVIRKRELEGHKEKVTCVEIKDGRRSVQDCFDPVTGALLTAQEDNWSFAYFDYKPLGKKLFPQTIVVFENFTVVATAQVVKMETTPAIDPKLFEPPPGAEAYPVCSEALGLALGAKGGKLVKQVNPISPQLPPNSGILSNDMIVSGILGRDGKLHNVAAGGTNPLAKEATLEAVRQWRYEPFTVCGHPIEMPVSFTMNYSKGGAYVRP